MRFKKIIQKVPLLKDFLQAQKIKEAQAWNIIAMQHLSEFKVPWMPWTGSSIRPSSLRAIMNEIRTHGRKSFLEFGSGISTLYLAEAARRWGGKVVSVEQDKSWQAIIHEGLKQAGTSEFVEFITVPLSNKSSNESSYEWYDQPVLDAATEGRRFDLVLVDAPISRAGFKKVRAPAGEWLQGRLMSDFCIFLDDIHRPGEQAIAEDWVKDFDWMYRNPWPRAEAAIFRPKAARPYNII